MKKERKAVILSAIGMSLMILISALTHHGEEMAYAATPTPFPTPWTHCQTVSNSTVILPSTWSWNFVTVSTTNSGFVYLEFGPHAAIGSAGAFEITYGTPWNDGPFLGVKYQMSAVAASSSWTCVVIHP